MICCFGSSSSNRLFLLLCALFLTASLPLDEQDGRFAGESELTLAAALIGCFRLGETKKSVKRDCGILKNRTKKVIILAERISGRKNLDGSFRMRGFEVLFALSTAADPDPDPAEYGSSYTFLSFVVGV
jgi:hypothetical protein